MPPIDLDLHPVDHITADALGQPGKRVFYIQSWQGERTVTLIIEKLQLQTLAVGIEQFLAEVQEKFPNLKEALAEFDEERMHIHPPVDPLFRVGEFGLGYDAESDLMVWFASGARATRYGQWRVGGSRWLLAVAPFVPNVASPWTPKGTSVPRRTGINIR
jgi:uncharacterized repeat protein (TIGR03847 family)